MLALFDGVLKAVRAQRKKADVAAGPCSSKLISSFFVRGCCLFSA
jgi:hypothetical protein